MSAPVILKGNYSHHFGSSMLPALEELFKWELSQAPSRREKFLMVKKIEGSIYQSSELADLPLFSAMSEGEDYSYQRPRQGATKTLTPVKYGLGVSISEEAMEDGKIDMISDAVRKMAKSARESQEIQAMDLINNGFSGTTTADGVALFATAHTLPSGGTFANRPSTEVDLSASSLEAALSDFDTNFVGDSGIIYQPRPKTLLVHTDSVRYARELVGSDLKPDTSDNNMNSLKSDGIEVVGSPHLSDTDAWFLLADKSETGLRVIVRKGIETKSNEEFDNDSLKYKSRYREIVGAIHAYGAWGTTGI
jgi:phage major head subunit gpT-like protein